ncbi:MAG: glycerol-3-phosphate 1-O-acyltransferase PlsY [Bacilli bacterium]|nr:glycerol-3-phosphate 1-O-acyltransferase PlsY [Bacilli bacterium]
MNIVYLLISIIIGYLFGSIPFALIVGKSFFNKDIREFGSKNLGGTNAGRVLGMKAGATVIALDILKVVLCFSIVYIIFNVLLNDYNYTYYLLFSGLFAIIGHCFPVFAQFKGGKAVSTLVGFALCTNYIILIIAVLFFLITLKRTKMVSLSSLIGSLVGAIISFIPIFNFSMLYGIPQNIYYGIFMSLATLILFIRHYQNIKRIISKTENKIKWMK